MTRALSFTQASVVRAVTAARKAGLTVTGIRADGTVLVQNSDEPLASDSVMTPTLGPSSRWEDVEA
jgi:hypothetical protein